MTRIRLVFQKRGEACFVRHVELPQLFGRIARRAGLKVASTQGMSPHPHIVMGAALPVGVPSLYELAEIWFADEICPEEALQKMNPVSPEGFHFLKAATIEMEAKSLNKSYDAAAWWLTTRDISKIEDAAAVLQKNFTGETLLSIRKAWTHNLVKNCEDSLEFSTHDPAGTGPAAFVKALVAGGVISGWPQVCVARLALGNWNADRCEVLPLL